MPNWTTEEAIQALKRINTLKRVLGIRNHPKITDTFTPDQIFYVYTADYDSAELLAELFHRYEMGPRRAYYPQNQSTTNIGNSIRVSPEQDGYEVSIRVKSAPNFSKALLRATDKQIAPDKGFSR